tara:strand:+ start:56 stop:1060 length:1005 start_codon:yes stop_codon:yes gene_type:complete
MTLIDSIYVNNGGAKILLEYLLQEIINRKLNENCFVLVDHRCNLPKKLLNNFEHTHLKGFGISRFSFYKKNKNKFSKVLCFGNVPPLIKCHNQVVFTYFHQPNYVDSLNFNFKNIHFFFKRNYINFLLGNSDYFIVQTNNMMRKFQDRFKYERKKLSIVPFYPSIETTNVKKVFSFFYPSLGYAHKNHHLLLSAFKKFYDKNKTGELILTIPKSDVDLFKKINDLNEKGYKIKNIGFVSRKEVFRYFNQSKYLIFPSLHESFGLGIIEGILTNCKLIAPDLDYVNSICEPSILINPKSESSLISAFEKALKDENIGSSILKIDNKIDDLIKMLF